jgi:hypothetical protein
MASFEVTTLTGIELRRPKIAAAALVVDDWTLAFRLGVSGKLLWHVIQNRNHFGRKDGGKKRLYRRFAIPKATGGRRVIHSPSRLMKVFLSQLRARILTPLTASLGPHVSAYRVGRSIRDAALLHLATCSVCAPADGPHTCQEEVVESEAGAGYRVLRSGTDECPACQPIPKHVCPRKGVKIHFDIHDFFGATRRSFVRQYFTEVVGYNFYVASLLADLMTVALEDPKGRVHHGVPQGAPTSGDLCNLVADARLDQPILEAFRGSGWKYSRYADDLYLSHPENLPRERVDEVIERIDRIIRAAGYRMNWKKVRVQRPSRRQEHLGLVMNQKLNLPSDAVRRLRAILHNCYRNGFEREAQRAGKENVERFVSWLRGRVGFMAMVNPQKAARLRKVLSLAMERHAEGGEGSHQENGERVT